jgi:GNAT superfamily N-acetyltransferase
MPVGNSMNRTFRVRRATLADLPVVMHHRRSMFEEMKYGDPLSLDATDAASESFFRKKMEEDKYFGWFIEDSEGNVVAGGGIVILDYQPQPLDPSPLRAYVVNMYTESPHRRQGFARLLMDTMIAWCKERRMNLLFLHASKDGRPLYESLGFNPTNEMRLDLRDSG